MALFFCAACDAVHGDNITSQRSDNDFLDFRDFSQRVKEQLLIYTVLFSLAPASLFDMFWIFENVAIMILYCFSLQERLPPSVIMYHFSCLTCCLIHFVIRFIYLSLPLLVDVKGEVKREFVKLYIMFIYFKKRSFIPSSTF